MAYKLLIDGKLVDGARTLDVVNPATGAVFETCACADEAQLNEAVAAAKAAFPAWSKLSFAERGAKMIALADAIDAHKEELARTLTQEQGKPLPAAQGEIAGSARSLRSFAAMTMEQRTLKETDKVRILEVRKPLGVVAAITPWNFPLAMMVSKLGPGLISGNTIVAKPPPTTPLTCLRVAELAASIFPAGVLNVIADANDLGGKLTSHPDVAKVTFTGSTATGKKVLESSAAGVKRVTLELGGNDAAIILDDVDVKKVAPKIFDGAMGNSGQVCIATKRVYAHTSIYDELCTELVRLAGEAVVDDGLKQGTTMGPLQNKQQFEKVKGYLEDAKANGKVIAGGAALDREGYFISPTIVRDIPDSARLVREEQFGPVLPVMAYDDVDDAITRANSTEYGLGGSVWTSDLEKGAEIASRIDSGTVWVNKSRELLFDVPFRGAKQSGLGTEKGMEGLEEFTQAKIINIAL